MDREAIVIKSVPDGPAPAEILQAWVGSVIPLATEQELARHPILGIRLQMMRDKFYIVRRNWAIHSLSQRGHFEAALFWARQRTGPYLTFAKSLCLQLRTDN